MKTLAILIMMALMPSLFAVGQPVKRQVSKVKPTAAHVHNLSFKLLRDNSNDPVPFAIAKVYRGKTFISGGISDIEGLVKLKGAFKINDKVIFNVGGYKQLSYKLTRKSLIEKGDIIVHLIENIEAMNEVVISYKRPIMSKDEVSTGGRLAAQEIVGLSSRSKASSRHKVRRERDYNNQKVNYGYSTSNISDNLSGNNEFKSKKPNLWIRTKDEPTSTFSADVDVASYGFCRRILDQGALPEEESVRPEEFINAMHYDYAAPSGNEIIATNTTLVDCPWAFGHKLLRVGLKTKNIAFDSVPPCNLVFLLDVSGSMSGEGRLDYVKQSMIMLTEQLRPQDMVSIVVYAGAAGIVLDGAKGTEKATIIGALERLESGGSTAGGAGIELAYQTAKNHFIDGGINRVILCTDGDFNVGVSSESGLEELIETKRKTNIFLSVLGYGMGNYKDNKLETLAGKGNGNYAYINTLADAKKVLVQQMSGTLMTLAKDCKFQISFNDKAVKKYKLIGYEDRLLNNQDFANDKKDAGEVGAGQTVTLFYELDMKVNYVWDKPEPQLAVLKVRYKLPEQDTSTLRTTTILNKSEPLNLVPKSTVLAISAAAFALQLQSNITRFDFEENAKLLIGHDLHKTEDGAQLLNYIKLAGKLMKEDGGSARYEDD